LTKGGGKMDDNKKVLYVIVDGDMKRQLDFLRAVRGKSYTDLVKGAIGEFVDKKENKELLEKVGCNVANS
jgi:hypothetical protein